MNGTVILGVVLIAAGLFLNGAALIPMLLVGVVVAAYGAFAPSRPSQHRAPRRLPSDSDPYV
jgi:hypothetical protein